MKLSLVKEAIKTMNEIRFQLPNGSFVPEHFHVTEVGRVTKHFIDCGGKVRTLNRINFQLWEADDYDHRLAPEKLLNIISLSEQKLQLEDHDVEVEYQQETIGIFDLMTDGSKFILVPKTTACLAPDQCGIPEKKKIKLSDIQNPASSCTPGGGCC